ncbi:hypothetical protein V2J09_002713 [Rumex salicifolius]
MVFPLPPADYPLEPPDLEPLAPPTNPPVDPGPPRIDLQQNPPPPKSFASTVCGRDVGPKAIPLSFVKGIHNVTFLFCFNRTNITLPKILWKENRIFVFHFDKEEDLIAVLERAPWRMSNNKPLILRRWQEGMVLDFSFLDLIPIWITMPNLDVRFWSEHMLQKIGSAVSTPILIDYNSANQERISFARVLVEISPTPNAEGDHLFVGGWRSYLTGTAIPMASS